MFKKLIKNKKAQQTAEYALLISLVVAAVIAMQTYAQRTLQARIRGASQYLTNKTGALGTEVQYEPYYLRSDYNVERVERGLQLQDINLVGAESNQERFRGSGGFQEQIYNGFGLQNGV